MAEYSTFSAVASAAIAGLKKTGGRGGGGPVRWNPGMLEMQCQSAALLIRQAYLLYAGGKALEPGYRGDVRGVPLVSDRLFAAPVQGLPGWASDMYTIEAKANGGASEAAMRGPMMRALLEERFKLQVHRGVKEVPVYELSVAKGGVRLSPSREGSCLDRNTPFPGPGTPGGADPKLWIRIPGEEEPMQRVCEGFFPGANGGTDVPGTSMAGLCRNLSNNFDRDVVD
jgi:hypothetical protein